LKSKGGLRYTHSAFYEHSYVAYRYGESVDEFYLRGPWEQARMIGFVRTFDKLEQLRIQEAAEK